MGLYDVHVDPFSAPVTQPASAAPAPAPRRRRRSPSQEQVHGAAAAETVSALEDSARVFFTKDAFDLLNGLASANGKTPKPVTPAAIDLCLGLRARVQVNMDTYVTPNAPKTVMINREWLVEMDRILRLDKIEPDTLAAVIAWATEDSFWRTNIRSPKALRKHATGMLMDQRYLRWCTAQGLTAWPDEVVALCRSMSSLLAYLFPGNPVREPDPAWFGGAEQLLRHYSLDDVEDMMDWARSSPRFRDRIGRLLVFPTLAVEVREANEFIAWAKERGRTWALGTTVLEQGGPGRRGKAQAKRIGASAPSNDLFVEYAQQTGQAS